MGPHDRQRLKAAMDRTGDARSYRRLQAVLLMAQGMAIRQVSQIAGARPWSIYAWVRRYLREHRAESLHDAPRSGRPRMGGALSGSRIMREFRHNPMRLGYNATGWTVSLLAAHLGEKYGQRVCPDTLRRRMRDLGLRWKRPRYVYTTKDPARGQKKGALYVA